jgi:methionyl aminopeptidase
MQDGGKILADILADLKSRLKIGTEVMSLENRFIELCKINNVIPGCKGYRAAFFPPFKFGLCLSINDESVHCYPKDDVYLRSGDLIAIDTVIKHKGLFVDSAFTEGIGDISVIDRKFLETAKYAHNSAVSKAIAGNHIGAIGHQMESIMNLSGFNVLYDFVGHGIGENMHEEPDVPCFGEVNNGPILKEGMTIAIEALVCQGDPEISYPIRGDWETKMADGKKFAIFEHTIAITKDAPIILTKR